MTVVNGRYTTIESLPVSTEACVGRTWRFALFGLVHVLFRKRQQRLLFQVIATPTHILIYIAMIYAHTHLITATCTTKFKIVSVLTCQIQICMFI